MIKLTWLYRMGFFIILALPILVLPNWFSPSDFGKTIVFRSILAVLLALFTYQILFQGQQLQLSAIKKNKLAWALGILMVVFLLATLFSQDRYFSLWGSPYRSGGVVTLCFYIIFAILAFLTLKKEDWNKILIFSIGVGAAVCLVALIQFYGLFSSLFVSVPGRPPSTIGNPILLGIYLVLLFFVALSLFIKENNKKIKVFYAAALLLFLVVIVITGSRAAYVGFTLGLMYFGIFYPKKNKPLKIAAVSLLAAMVLAIYLANTNALPSFLKENKIAQQVIPRLSLKTVLDDPRFSAWRVGWRALQEKPILGWGPENFNIGFDKHYDPSLPYISKEWGGWWDRAHNMLLETAVTLGIPGFLVYMAFFGYLFWRLQRIKYALEDKRLIVHGLQATFIAYFAAVFFFFDSFATYLILFLLVGYSLHLTHSVEVETHEIHLPGKKLVFTFLCLGLAVFLWQYNLLPLYVNAKINKADALVQARQCDMAFLMMDNAFSKGTFLQAYTGTVYVDHIKTCLNIHPEKRSAYIEKGYEVSQKSIVSRPRYSRLLISGGSFAGAKGSASIKSAEKSNLFQEALSYFQRAQTLAPNHQEVFIEWSKLGLATGDYRLAEEKANACVTKEENLGECYWIRGLAKIYLQQIVEAKKDIAIAEEKNFSPRSAILLHQLANAYASIENYQELSLVYEKLIGGWPHVPEYHSSLAFAYAKMGQYAKARKEALIFLELMPEAETEVNAFLKTLPY